MSDSVKQVQARGILTLYNSKLLCFYELRVGDKQSKLFKQIQNAQKYCACLPKDIIVL